MLLGKKDGLQLWANLYSLRDFTGNFNTIPAIEDNNESLRNLLGYIFEEIYMDKTATMNLLSKYYMVHSRRLRAQVDSIKLKAHKPIRFNINKESFDYVNEIVEKKFGEAIFKCYSSFSKISTPLLSRDDINDLVDLYKTNLSYHYRYLMIMFGFDKKIELARNKHLKLSGYYDRIVFYQYLLQTRVRCNHLLTNWGIVNTAAAYARGSSSVGWNSFFGNSTAFTTLMRRTKDYREQMPSFIYQQLQNEQNLVACIDNNQKGFALKHQRFGKSNKFVKVTGCVLKKYSSWTYGEQVQIDDKVNLSYHQQVVPSPYGMPHYEKINMTNRNIYNESVNTVKNRIPELDENIYPMKENESVCFSGKRVARYSELCSIYQQIDLIRKTLAGTYIQKSNTTKFVSLSPDRWKTHDIIEIGKRMNYLKGSFLFKHCKYFQYECVSK